VGEAEIDARDLSLPKLHLERPLGIAGPGVDEKTGGVLVEPVDDAEHPRRGGNTTPLPLGAYGVHEGRSLPFLVRDARDPRGLLDDDEVPIFVDD
jgi:hypothetical protein